MEQALKAKRNVDAMVENDENLEDVQKTVMDKSLYLLAEELKNDTNAPLLDTYGRSGVYQNYKQNKFFEKMSIIDLKRARDREAMEFMKELYNEERIKRLKQKRAEERRRKMEEDREIVTQLRS